MTRISPLRARLPLVALLALLALTGCQAAGNLFFEPAPTDPNDGYEGSLAQTGVNTEMDWGPKQNLLLSEFKALREKHTLLEKRLDTLIAENQNLKTQLNDEQDMYRLEKGSRAQIEAQFELARQKLSEQEATILSLRIEKAKLEQTALLAQIDLMQATMRDLSPGNVEASAMPPANR
ncbi:MAG: hypothetical protein KDC98_23080 [Planctomycetes bacterium]|nr:hypothetical protein [Planctomycetota bacterium]